MDGRLAVETSKRPAAEYPGHWLSQRREIRMLRGVSSEGWLVQQETNLPGRSQSPVVWIAEVMETEILKPIDKVSPGEATSHRAVIKVKALWPRKCNLQGPSPQRRGEGDMNSRNLIDAAVHLGGVEATAR